MEQSILEQLREPFPASDIEWRVMRSGKKNGKIWAKVYAYVQARAIQNRLDEVFGLFGYQTEYKPIDMIGEPSIQGFICIISIRDDKSERWVNKSDGAPLSDIEPFKGGISMALKRTASAGLGIGRYLYDLDEGWADINDNGRYFAKLKIKDQKDETFRWDPPSLPANALPSNHQKQKGLNPGMVKNIETLAEKFWGKDWEKELTVSLVKKYDIKSGVNIGTYKKLLIDEQGLMICTGLKEAIAIRDKVNPADVQNSLKNTQDLERMDIKGMSDLFLETLRDELKLSKTAALIHANKMSLQTHSKEYDRISKDEIRTLLLEAMKKDKSFDREAEIKHIFVDLLGQIGGKRFEKFKSEKFSNRQVKDWKEKEIIKFRDDLEAEIKSSAEIDEEDDLPF